MGVVRPTYTVSQIATALRMSRWAARRWLDANKIPYEQARPGNDGTRGSQILVLLSDLRTYGGKFFASAREAAALAEWEPA